MYVIEDEFPNKGPLSGIYSGLNSSINEEVFIIGADYPFLSKNFINYMCKLSEGKRSIFIKNKEIGAASIHKNQTTNPPKIAPKLFPLPPTITITQIKKVYLMGR